MSSRIALAGLLMLTLTAAPTTGAPASATRVPERLRAPQQNVVLFEALANGFQVYVCRARADDPNAFEWTFKEPIAELWNERGERVGTHYAGPTWEANDGSKVVGEVVERASAPDAGAIPWLLLRAKPDASSGTLSNVTFVQRLETVGGIAPAEGCDGSVADFERDVEYTATYVFYVSRDDAW